jgi:hypothetical protein
MSHFKGHLAIEEADASSLSEHLTYTHRSSVWCDEVLAEDGLPKKIMSYGFSIEEVMREAAEDMRDLRDAYYDMTESPT